MRFSKRCVIGMPAKFEHSTEAIRKGRVGGIVLTTLGDRQGLV